MQDLTIDVTVGGILANTRRTSVVLAAAVLAPPILALPVLAWAAHRPSTVRVAVGVLAVGASIFWPALMTAYFWKANKVGV